MSSRQPRHLISALFLRVRERSERSVPALAWPADDGTLGYPRSSSRSRNRGGVERAYSQEFAALDRPITLFLCLPLATLDSFALQKQIDEIGKK
jgi:hypothetical protein